MITIHDDISDVYRVAEKCNSKLHKAVTYKIASDCFWRWLSEGKLHAAELMMISGFHR